ncbi:SRPBCC domain-containing protein [Streptomyces sp. NPDC058307]|uniref:SRPBCC family protein n=1 Tax=Streptomyces sp. NPDC058307 TaxID=3346439 RepID=UPI0036E15D87
MQEAEAFRLQVGHRFTMTSVPRPDANVPGTADVEVLAFEPHRTPSLRWTDADPVNSAHRTVTWKVEQEGPGTRLFLVHGGFDPDGPARPMARTIMDGGGRTHVTRARGHTMERIKRPKRHICNHGNTPRARASAHASAREQSYDPDQLTTASLATRATAPPGSDLWTSTCTTA